MKNYRGTGDRVVVTAPGTITSGQLVYVSGFVGVAETSAASGQRVALRITGEFEIPTIASAAKGDRVHITTNGNHTVSRTAAGTAGAAGSIPAGVITATPTDTNTADASSTSPPSEPVAGKIWVRLHGPYFGAAPA